MPSILAGAAAKGYVPTHSVAPPPPPPPPPPHPSGFEPPDENITGFTLRWVEDFTRTVAEGTLTTDGSAAPFNTVYGLAGLHNDLPGGIPTSLGTYPSSSTDSYHRGRYGAANLSVAEGSSVVREHVRYEAGWPRVSAITPRCGTAIPSNPYGDSNVLGGAFELVWRSDVLNTYKFVPLLWPLSNTSKPDGEIDWPEANQYGNGAIKGFMHWQGDTPGTPTEQSTYTSPSVVLADGKWHKTRTEWIPGTPFQNGTLFRSTGGSVKWYLDDVLVRTINGSTNGTTGPFIPCTPMHWVIQQETILSNTIPVDQTANGYVDIDWLAFYSWDG